MAMTNDDGQLFVYLVLAMILRMGFLICLLSLGSIVGFVKTADSPMDFLFGIVLTAFVWTLLSEHERYRSRMLVEEAPDMARYGGSSDE